MSGSSRVRGNLREVGRASAAALGLAVLAILNIAPGWEGLAIFAPGFASVLGLANLALAVAVVANLSLLVFDARWYRAASHFVLALFGLVLSATLLDTFPFELTALPTEALAAAKLGLLVSLLASGAASVGGVITLGFESIDAARRDLWPASAPKAGAAPVEA